MTRLAASVICVAAATFAAGSAMSASGEDARPQEPASESLFPEIAEEGMDDLRRHMELAFGNGKCPGATEHAREILRRLPDDLPALQVIADCTRDLRFGEEIGRGAMRLFEDSRVLSLLPQLLDAAKVKDLVPILRDVETKEDKSVTDLLFIGQVYEKLGRPEAQLRALEDAMALDPDDPRPHLAYAGKKFAAGDRSGARAIYRNFLSTARPEIGQLYLFAYVAALAFPFPTVLLLIAVCWGLGYLAMRNSNERLAFLHGELRPGPMRQAFRFLAAALPPVLGFQFWLDGRALPFGLLVLIALTAAGVLAGPPVLRPLRPWFAMARRGLASLFSERFARSIARFPTGWRILIALGALVALIGGVPALGSADLKIAATVLCAMLFFGTVGSLIVTFLRHSDSLRTSLRWIGASATIPFLAVYVVNQWSELGEPLLAARPLDPRVVRGFFSYLGLWLVSVVLALHLSRILADALVSPVREMMEKVRRIEGGDFGAKVAVVSKDELGALGEAVNRMADGLARREYVEKTFSRYVDVKVAERILSGDAAEIRIAGQRRQAVVLFSDIRGFTRMSEKLSPEQVIAILNQYFESMVETIRAHGGVIDKYMGDAIMAHWGVLAQTGDEAKQAVSAALAMRHSMEDFNRALESQGHSRIGVGIGINAGEVVAGSLGSKDRMEYTIIGDVVNTAQRGEANAMAQQILITEAVYREVAEIVDAEALEGRVVKGKAEPVYFWSVDALKGEATDTGKSTRSSTSG